MISFSEWTYLMRAQASQTPGATFLILLLLTAIFLLIVAAAIHWYMTRSRNRRDFVHAIQLVTLEVRLPKYTFEKEEENGKQEKDLISIAEQFYTNLSGIDRKTERI